MQSYLCLWLIHKFQKKYWNYWIKIQMIYQININKVELVILNMNNRNQYFSISI